MASAGEHLVVGGGLSGLYAALLLARAGQRVRVLERSCRLGGLAGSEEFRGIPCDLGSHRLHPAALDRPLFRELHALSPFLQRPRRGVLLFEGARVPYPPTALSMASALGIGPSVALGLSLVASARKRRALAAWERDRAAPGDDLGFERFVTERVGERAYRAFYRPYAEKVWGLDPAELSQSVAKRRVSTTRPWALLRSAAGRAAAWIEGGESERGLGGFVYPARGTSSIIAWLTAELSRAGVPIERGRPFRREDLDGRPVLFAGDLRDLVATPLEHRGLYLIYLALPIDRAGEPETYYSPDPRFWFGRVSELQNYSPDLRRPGETILCVEIPEGAWGPGVDFAAGARLTSLLAQLATAGILPPGLRPLEVRQRFVRGVYPLYRRGWLAHWQAAMRQVSALGRVVPIGRQALFLHVNLDHCADIAEEAVAHVLGGGGPEAWIERAAAYLEVRVRD